MAAGLELKHVQRGRGRVHLAAAVRPDAPVHTLCGREFPPGSARTVDAAADCSACRRRERDPAAVSGAFFEEGIGERMLELSLAQARAQRKAREEPSQPAPRPAPAPAPAAKRAAAPPSASKPRRRGELDPAGLREFSENVYVAPGGEIVRLEGERVAEVVGEGRYQVLRRGERLRLKVGEMVVEAEVGRVAARLERPKG